LEASIAVVVATMKVDNSARRDALWRKRDNGSANDLSATSGKEGCPKLPPFNEEEEALVHNRCKADKLGKGELDRTQTVREEEVD
jgi:hypothetical protein